MLLHGIVYTFDKFTFRLLVVLMQCLEILGGKGATPIAHCRIKHLSKSFLLFIFLWNMHLGFRLRFDTMFNLQKIESHFERTIQTPSTINFSAKFTKKSTIKDSWGDNIRNKFNLTYEIFTDTSVSLNLFCGLITQQFSKMFHMF